MGILGFSSALEGSRFFPQHPEATHGLLGTSRLHVMGLKSPAKALEGLTGNGGSRLPQNSKRGIKNH
jgi:hypothetical protein